MLTMFSIPTKDNASNNLASIQNVSILFIIDIYFMISNEYICSSNYQKKYLGDYQLISCQACIGMPKYTCYLSSLSSFNSYLFVFGVFSIQQVGLQKHTEISKGIKHLYWSIRKINGTVEFEIIPRAH